MTLKCRVSHFSGKPFPQPYNYVKYDGDQQDYAWGRIANPLIALLGLQGWVKSRKFPSMRPRSSPLQCAPQRQRNFCDCSRQVSFCVSQTTLLAGSEKQAEAWNLSTGVAAFVHTDQDAPASKKRRKSEAKAQPNSPSVLQVTHQCKKICLRESSHLHGNEKTWFCTSKDLAVRCNQHQRHQ